MLQPPKRSLLLASLIGIPLFLFLIALWQLPTLQVAPLQKRMKSITNLEKLADLEKELIVAENSIRTSMIQGIGGILVAITAYVGYLNYRALLDKNAADRFSKAVEQLGNDNIHVRLGGIYALEQIAKDAEEKYYWSVMETLTAYVREKSPAPKEPTDPDDIPPLETDIKAVMTVISRRKYSYGALAEPYRLDLKKVDLRGLKLPKKANLSGIQFFSSNLQGVWLGEVNLEQTRFHEAKLQQAWLRESHFCGSEFIEANLCQANLVGAKLTNTDFGGADLSKVDLLDAQLQDSKLVKTILQDAVLMGANLERANLSEADLRNARLGEAILNDVRLSGANLQGADIHETNLQRAKFAKYLIWSDAIDLTWEQLRQAKNWQQAELPDYLLQNLPAEEVEEVGNQEAGE